MAPTETPENRAIPFRIADDDAIARLVPTLGLDRFRDAGAVVDRAETLGDTVRLHVAWRGVGEAWLALRRADGQPAFCSTPRIALAFAGGGEVSRPFALLARRLAASLGDRTVDDLAHALRPGDPDAAPLPADDAPSPINSWAVDDAWRSFLCDGAQQRKLYESFRFEGHSSFVVHGDLECRFVTPRARTRLPRFFNYPLGLAGEAEGREPFTDLQDLDVIGGGEARLDATVREEIARIGDRGPVIVNTTCIPVVIGDGVDEVVARHRGECAHGVYHLSPRTVDPLGVFLQYLDRVKERFRGHAWRPIPGTVALVGFRDEPAREELILLLGEAGIGVAGCVLPEAGEDLMEQALCAEVLVFRPSAFHDDLYRRLFGDWDRRRLGPPAPWGFALTEAWLAAVGDAVGRGDAARAVAARRHRELDAKARALRDATAGRILGFVVDPSQAMRLVDPLTATGLPVARVARDLGFAVRVLVHAADPGAFRDFGDRLRQAEPGIEIAGFDGPAALDAALADPAVVAVFTEYFFDHRLTRRGKGQFSAREFEIGLDGAVRTLARLARLSAVPFWRDHGRRCASRWWPR